METHVADVSTTTTRGQRYVPQMFCLGIALTGLPVREEEIIT